jgi:hypothetical protein
VVSSATILTNADWSSIRGPDYTSTHAGIRASRPPVRSTFPAPSASSATRPACRRRGASLANYYSHGHDPRWILDAEAESDAVTVERVREAARRYLDPSRHVLGVLYPEDSPPTP